MRALAAAPAARRRLTPTVGARACRCVYELYKSLVGGFGEQYTYDLVTATAYDWGGQHGAVAIIDGLSAQQGSASAKHRQESAFPLAVLEKGIAFESKEGEASVKEDKERIVIDIGDKSSKLDATVHGVVARAGLRAALEAGGKRRTRFLEAVRHGGLHKLSLSLEGSEADTLETWKEVMGALDPQTMREVAMQTRLESVPEGLFQGLPSLTKVDMRYCPAATPALKESLRSRGVEVVG